MVVVIHEYGWGASNKSKLDAVARADRTIERYIEITEFYNANGTLKVGQEVELYTQNRELKGVVKTIGFINTIITLTGETTGVKDKLKQILNNG